MQFFDFYDARIDAWTAVIRQCEGVVSNDSLSTQHEFKKQIDSLMLFDRYWSFPGPELFQTVKIYIQNEQFFLLLQLLNHTINAIKSEISQLKEWLPMQSIVDQMDRPLCVADSNSGRKKPNLDVLIIHPMIAEYAALYQSQLSSIATDRDEFFFSLIFVDSAEDAWTAILANPAIQSVVIVPGFSWHSKDRPRIASDYDEFILDPMIKQLITDKDPTAKLSIILNQLRPKLDLFLISSIHPSQIDPVLGRTINRVIYSLNPLQDLHHAIINGIRSRYSTPFFHALEMYSKKPKEIFHALPLARGKSVKNSPWINDMYTFYGANVFMAETSSTQGGLDSLMDPKGAIKQAMDKAANCFGSDHCFFVTNGTSTANKIVHHATINPGDIVLIGTDCHKSIPYAAMMAGAYPLFLENQTLPNFDLYGPVPLEKIKLTLCDLRDRQILHKVKLLALTHCTFDGVLYDVETVMREVLAIKPDIVFHWDEAWFATGYFDPILRTRSAIAATRRLQSHLSLPDYCERHSIREPKLRVYVTHSTHKTLSSFRQGSMIHIIDEEWNNERFIEAFRIYSSTSPNYQIIASLDVSRRQMSLEGFHLIKKTLSLASTLRISIETDPNLSRYFRIFSDHDLESQPIAHLNSSSTAYATMLREWRQRSFVIDPTRITVDVHKTGMDGSTFRQLLISKYDIQVNKTSQNTVLFIINIGTTDASITYLLSVMRDITARLKCPVEDSAIPPLSLPMRRLIHPHFQPDHDHYEGLCDIRRAYYAGLDPSITQFMTIGPELTDAITQNLPIVSAGFVIPYPPGFPLLIPGQLITLEIIEYLHRIKIKEIHGYSHHNGLKVFCPSALN